MLSDMFFSSIIIIHISSSLSESSRIYKLNFFYFFISKSLTAGYNVSPTSVKSQFSNDHLNNKLTHCFPGRCIEARCQCLGPQWPRSCPQALWEGCDETVWLKLQTSSCLPAGTERTDERTANHLRDTHEKNKNKTKDANFYFRR